MTSMNKIADTPKMYNVFFKVIGDNKTYTGMAHGLYADEAKELFLKRNPGSIIQSVEEIKVK